MAWTGEIMVNYIGTARLRGIGVPHRAPARFIEELAAEIEADYRRWNEFEKSARHASHSAVGVIELMPTSDGRLYSFKYVNGHPKNTARGSAHGHGLRRARRCRHRAIRLLLSEMTFVTALRTAAMSALAARRMARAGEPRHGPDRQRRAERISGHRLSSHARHPRAAAVRHRPARHRQTDPQSRRRLQLADLSVDALRRARARRCAAPTSSPRSPRTSATPSS